MVRAIVMMILLALQIVANAYPTKPVRIVIPYPVGGGTDILSRYVLAKVEANTGWSIVIENKAGATGIVGSRDVANAKPDGYTLLMGHIAPNAINPGAFTTPRFEPDWDVDAVALVAEAPSLLLASPKIGARTVQELRAHMSKQNDVMYGSDGYGSLAHLQMESFIGNAPKTHVAYKGGGPAVQGIMGGEVPMLFSPAPVAMPFISTGKFIVIAQTGAARLNVLPSIPTMAESGDKRLGTAPLWWGLFAPKGTPGGVKDAWAAAIKTVLNADETRKWLDANGYSPAYLGPVDFSAYVEKERQRWMR